MVGNRFDAADRELLLINDRRDVDTYPLATLSGLQYALSAVAQKMDPDRDILFLALSSHGSPDPELAVSNAGLPLAQLSADDLQSALRDSGIKRRIIVISACYAGGFIPALRNPDTIVIAAAATVADIAPVLWMLRRPGPDILRRGVLPRRIAGRGLFGGRLLPCQGRHRRARKEGK